MAEKICAICGKDCSTAPRIKDSKGRYAHSACVEKLQTRKARKPQQDPGGGEPRRPKAAAEPITAGLDLTSGLDADYGDIDPETGQAVPNLCPSCGRPVARDAMICTHCGTNLQSGRKMKTKVETDSGEEKRVRASSGGGEFLQNPWLYFFVPLVIGVVFGGLVFVSPLLTLVGYLLLGVIGLAAVVWAIIEAFQNTETGWGVGQILGLLFCGGLPSLIYVFFFCEESRLKGLFGGYILGIIALMGFAAGALGTSGLAEAFSLEQV